MNQQQNDDSSLADDDQRDENPMAKMQDDQKLSNDYDTPFSPPSGVQDRLGPTHPQTDTNIDAQERYDEGIEGASGTNLPGSSADENETETPI